MGYLTQPEFLAQLDSLSILAKRVLGGTLRADRKSDKKGTGINFADYAEYNPGDDFRAIDWNLYGKLEILFVKLFELEEDTSISLFIDLSTSMGTKELYAKKLAASLAYIALQNMDRLSIYGIADKLEVIQRPSHGKGKVFTMLKQLEEANLYGKDTDIASCVKEFQMHNPKKGVCVFISDFFSPSGIEKGMDLLKFYKHDLFCIHLVDPEETKCDWKGDIRLECIETKKINTVTIGPKEAKQYENAVQDWFDNLKRNCQKKEIGYLRTSIEIPFEEVIQKILRSGGLVA
ncbi:MAG: hypothetical protein COA79_19125 [Planctomycetota bacterium]|nr:MAG: hypothetical protein COA79_19125 [Planctomycetota bacterium]